MSFSLAQGSTFMIRKMSVFTGRGAPENWRDQVLFLRSKKGGGHLYFLKETKYFVKHFRFQRKGTLDATRGRKP